VPEVWLSATLARLSCEIPGAEEQSGGCKLELLDLGNGCASLGSR